MSKIEITLNNKKQEFEAPISLNEVVSRLPLKSSFGVAACVNGDIVEKEQWKLVQIQSGDVIDILRAFQGG